MNIEQARAKASVVASVEIGSTVYNRFCEQIKLGVPVSYFDRMSPEKRGFYDVLTAVNGLPGEMNFYLREV